MKDKINIFWFRRDLRLDDNTGLIDALRAGLPVLPIFMFDTEILDRLENKHDARVEFIHNAIIEIDTELKRYDSSLLTIAGKPADIWRKLTDEYEISEVFTNHDYEPYAIKRDSEVNKLLGSKGIKFSTFKDQVIFEKNEVVKPDGRPYSIIHTLQQNMAQNSALKILKSSH